jgi:hypothetical protein
MFPGVTVVPNRSQHLEFRREPETEHQQPQPHHQPPTIRSPEKVVSSFDGPTRLEVSPFRTSSIADVVTEEELRIRKDVTIQMLCERLLSDTDKVGVLQELGSFLDGNEARGFAMVLPHLIRLCKSRFAPEVEKVLQIIGQLIDSGDLLDFAVPLLHQTYPALFVEFLIRVVACASKGDLWSRVRRIMDALHPLLQHQSAEVRKYSVLCIVEMRVVLGAEFDVEINRLKNVPRKLVLHYFQKRLQGSAR